VSSVLSQVLVLPKDSLVKLLYISPAKWKIIKFYYFGDFLNAIFVYLKCLFKIEQNTVCARCVKFILFDSPTY